MNYLRKQTLLIAGLAFMLSGCSSGMSAMDQAAQKAKMNEPSQKEENSKELEKEWSDFYKDKSIPIDDVLAEEQEVTDKSEQKLIVRDAYTDPDEFSAFVAHSLFTLRKGEMSAEQYLTFLTQFGSQYLLLEYQVGDDKEKDLQFTKTITKAMKEESNGVLAKYEPSIFISDNDNNLSGYVYVKYLENTGNSYTEQVYIKKEDKVWKINEIRKAPNVIFKGDGKVLEPSDEEGTER